MVEYIDADQLREWMDTLEINTDFTIIDVRDDDFVMGNIPGAVNCPSATFDPIVQYGGFVVFHCALSQVRGPKCAKMYANVHGRAFVLRGGFSGWQAVYKNTKYVENLVPSFWE
jgi:Cdc25 family phosphatase